MFLLKVILLIALLLLAINALLYIAIEILTIIIRRK